MKRISTFLVVLFLAGITTLHGCFHDDFRVRGSDPIRTQERLLNSFDKVISEMSTNVYIHQGDVRVYAVSNLDIEILGSGDVYYIGFPLINQRVPGSGRLYNSNESKVSGSLGINRSLLF